MKKKVTKEQRPLKVTLIIYFCSEMATFWNESKTVVGGHSWAGQETKMGLLLNCLPVNQQNVCGGEGGR